MLSLVERWLSSKIGEGLIYDLRVRLFDHVQRLPVAFFTRAQTGALVSRLNNDVIGAQRALTGTLGSVVSNVVVLVTTVIAMIALEWRLTVLAIALLPAFLIPAKRVGTRLQDISREQMERNARMNSTMTERFGVAGAMLVKLFGRHDDETSLFSDDAAGVRDAGVKSAVLSRVFFSTLSLVAALGIAAVYWWGGLLVIDGTITIGTLVALAALVTRIYQPLTALTNARIDVMTAFVSFERVFEVLDIRNPIQDRPGAIDLVDVRGEIDFDDVWFTYPTADQVSLPSLDGAVPDHDSSSGPVLRGITAHIEPGQLVAVVGPSGAGKTTLDLAAPPPLRRRLRRRSDRRHRRPRPHPGDAAPGHRRGVPGPAPVPRHHRRQPPLRRPRRHPGRPRAGVRGGPDPPRHRRPPRRLRHRGRRPRATACPAARSSACRSPACC